MTSETHSHGEDEEPLGGTLAVPYGIVGALVVGTAGACIAWFVLWPLLGVALPWAALFCYFVAALPFGAIAGGLAGAAESRPQSSVLAERSQPSRARRVSSLAAGRA